MASQIGPTIPRNEAVTPHPLRFHVCHNYGILSIGKGSCILLHVQNKNNIFYCISFFCRCKTVFRFPSSIEEQIEELPSLLHVIWSLFYFCSLRSDKEKCMRHYFESTCNKILSIGYVCNCKNRLCLP